MKKKLMVTAALSTACIAVFAQSNSQDLKTPTINQIGLTVSSYSYKEPSLSVQMDATNVGIEYLGTYAFYSCSGFTGMLI